VSDRISILVHESKITSGDRRVITKRVPQRRRPPAADRCRRARASNNNYLQGRFPHRAVFIVPSLVVGCPRAPVTAPAARARLSAADGYFGGNIRPVECLLIVAGTPRPSNKTKKTERPDGIGISVVYDCRLWFSARSSKRVRETWLFGGRSTSGRDWSWLIKPNTRSKRKPRPTFHVSNVSFP